MAQADLLKIKTSDLGKKYLRAIQESLSITTF